MRRYDYSHRFDVRKHKQQEWDREHKAGGFKCSHCKQFVVINDNMGTNNRNHCNMCLWSKHVDNEKGDRRSTCHAGMKPVALTYKHEGFGRQGEIMLVHVCMACNKVSINRIARDDSELGIYGVYESSIQPNGKTRYQGTEIDILRQNDARELNRQLYGR